MGEILYALGNVTTKQANLLGKSHLNESLDSYEVALLHFESAVRANHDSAAGIAKTHYKLVIHHIRSHSYKLAKYENHSDVSMDLLTQPTVSMLTRLWRSTPAIPLATPTWRDCFSNRAEYRP